MKPAVVAITRGGAALARRIRDAYPGGADVYLPRKFVVRGEAGVKALKEDLAGEAGRLFGKYRAIAFVMAAGIVVRLIAPHMKDKLADPAVVVLDEKGRHVVSLLSGHAGGANVLAEEIACLIGAEPVITTASDVQGMLAVDTLAERLGCAVEDYEAAKRVTAAIVNGGTVSLYSHIDPEVLADKVKKMPENLVLYSTLEDLVWSDRDASIIITPSVLPGKMMKKLGTAAVLRPRVLAVGMGCNRGTSARELEGLFMRTFREHGLSPLSVRNLTTVEDKRDEAGLNVFAVKRGFTVEYFPRERLLKAATPSGRSEKVFRNMGVYGVCEPAALLSAGAERLLVAKVKSKNATLAVAEAVLP